MGEAQGPAYPPHQTAALLRTISCHQKQSSLARYDV